MKSNLFKSNIMVRYINSSKILITILIIFFSFLSAFGQTRKDSLIVFVGENIEIKEIHSRDFYELQSKYLAKYKILQLVHGTYKSDTIEFIVYSHEDPIFPNYQTVLLFVYEDNGVLIHETNHFFHLYMTEKGKWASPYPTFYYGIPTYKDRITVVPEKISFIDEVSFSSFVTGGGFHFGIKYMTANEIQRYFPQPFYKIEEDRAIAVYGNYVEDLFRLFLDIKQY